MITSPLCLILAPSLGQEGFGRKEMKVRVNISEDCQHSDSILAADY